MSKKGMTTGAAGRIQAAEANRNGGQVKADGFAARAQRAAAQNVSAVKPSPGGGTKGEKKS